MFISAYKVLPLGNTVSVRTISPSNWVIILLRISLNCLVVLPRVQIAGQRPVWDHRPTLSFDGQALVHSSRTAAVQFYYWLCLPWNLPSTPRGVSRTGIGIHRQSAWTHHTKVYTALRCLNAWQADSLKYCRYYTLGGPLWPSLFFWNDEIILTARYSHCLWWFTVFQCSGCEETQAIEFWAFFSGANLSQATTYFCIFRHCL